MSLREKIDAVHVAARRETLANGAWGGPGDTSDIDATTNLEVARKALAQWLMEQGADSAEAWKMAEAL